jgi:hypothetical protein
VLDSGAGFADGGMGRDAIRAIRDRLHALYGPAKQLVLQKEEARDTQAVLEIRASAQTLPRT